MTGATGTTSTADVADTMAPTAAAGRTVVTSAPTAEDVTGGAGPAAAPTAAEAAATRQATLEPDLTAAALKDPVGPLAAPVRVRLEHLLPGDVLGGASATPRISWEIPTAPPGWVPVSADLEVTYLAPDDARIGETRLLPLSTADGVLAQWPGEPLSSRERVVLRVRVTGTVRRPGPGPGTSPAASPGTVGAPASPAGPATLTTGPAALDPAGPAGSTTPVTTPFSQPIIYEAGLLAPEDWQALPVGPAWPENPASQRRPPRVRHEFSVSSPVVAARAYLSAHGLIRAEVNGTRVGSDELVPGWTVYGERLVARAYDVTAAVRAASPAGDGVGTHAVGAQLADGWYRGRIGFDGGYHNLYGEDIAAVVQLELSHPDGSRTVVASDSTWTAGAGEILFTGLYEGETVDARLADPAWSRPGYHGAGWSPVTVGASDAHRLVMASDAPVRDLEELEPLSVELREAVLLPVPEVDVELVPRRVIVDFGQNISGRLRIRVHGPAGTRIRLRHAEVLEDAELGTRPLRGAAATDTYTLRGTGEETWEPAFTVHGFRYAEVVGWPGEPDQVLRSVREGVRAVVVHTQMERLGAFSCSEELVTRLHENSRWSMRDNFVSIPTDCPQRDERLGWTGDIQAFAPTAAFHYECTAMLGSWLEDLATEQRTHGTVPWYVPVIPGGLWTPPRPAAVWGDAAVLVPWELFRATGDRGLLERQYDSARGWVDLVDSLAGEDHVWDTGLQLGDWLDPAAPPDNPMQALTDRYLVATAYFAHSAHVLSLWAAELGEQDDARHYADLAQAVGQAFRSRYTDGQGRMTSHSQTAYALAIAFDLCGSPRLREQAGRHLADLVAEAGGHVATGFAGTPVLTAALTATGQVEAAYRLLLETTCPSWLYAVTMGATTTWERWDSMLPDGSVNPGGMTSFNHYALGAVAAWLQRSVGGLAPAEPGYRVIEVAPVPGGGLTSAESVHRTPYGWAASSWRLVSEAGGAGSATSAGAATGGGTDEVATGVGRPGSPDGAGHAGSGAPRQAARSGAGRLEVDVVVPVGATARVTLPGHEDQPPVELSHGRHHLETHLG